MNSVSERRPGSILSKYEKSFSNNITLVADSKKGLRAQAVFDLISLSEFSFPVIEKVLNKTIKTFTSYKKNQTNLDSTISEKLLKIFSLYDKGVAVFGNINEFNKWIAAPSFGLGNMVPRDLLDTVTGIELVYDELVRIEYGDLA
ncbi:MAG: antitoxin Xre/MbcA/ParS toxin-binding domain-containing protein [Ginsengibacter sp.]